MGRQAKYRTREDRLTARREQSAKRAAEPGAKEVRRLANQRAWRKKRLRKLLNEPPPDIPEQIREHAEMELSTPGYSRMFEEFAKGRDCIGLEEVDVEPEDLRDMMGAALYPSKITSISNFSEEWPVLCAALHGALVHRHLQYCDDLISKCQEYPEHHIVNQLHDRFHELHVEYNRTNIASRLYSENGDEGGLAIATLNLRWTARTIVETVGDIITAKKGCGYLIQVLVERKWNLSYVRQPEYR